MKNRNDFEEFLRQLEERLEEMLDEIDISEDRPIDIGISVNICPVLVLNSTELYHPKEEKTPVDILETEKNIHAVVGLPEVEKESIKLTCDGRTLDITACNAVETVRETVRLPSRVNKKGMKVTYENGILEVVLVKSRKPVKKSNV